MRFVCKKRFLSSFSAAARIAVPSGLLAVTLLLTPQQASAQSGQSFLYGIDSTGNGLYAINPNASTATLIRDLDGLAGSVAGSFANGLANNNAQSLLYFHIGATAGTANAGNGAMYYFNPAFANNAPTAVTYATGVTAPTGRYSNAAFFNNAYWAFLDNTDTLVRMNFNAAGTQVTSINQYANVAGTTSNSLYFGGDIAIRSSNGILYGFASNNVNGTGNAPANSIRYFFSLDVNDNDGSAVNQGSLQANFSSSVVNKGNAGFGYQLGFSLDGSTLYGSSSNGTTTGEFQTINTTSPGNAAVFGNATTFDPPGAATTFNAGGLVFLDLSDSMVPTPAPPGVVSGLVGLAVGGSHFGFLRFRRNRRRRNSKTAE